jgi:stage II sporulation protein D
MSRNPLLRPICASHLSIGRIVCLIASCLLSIRALGVETMRIGMGGASDEVTVRGKGLAFGTDSDEPVLTPLPANRALVRRSASGLEIDGAPWPQSSVRFRAGSNPPTPQTNDEELRLAGHRVRGDVVIRVARSSLELINVLPLEDYLIGVLGNEMPPDFPDEALKAQAVAARTYALRRKLGSNEQPYHLGSSVLHQVYRGLERENARVRSAVDSTHGEILTYDLEPIEAYFHASCGGRTESGLDALTRNLPYLQPVDCPCGRLPASHWELSLPTAELAALLGQKDASPLSISSRSRTGRAKFLRLGNGDPIDAATFRQQLGYGKLKSLWFEVVDSGRDGSVKLSGRGYGHGAGLCQWGAKLFANSGWNYRQILEHYYPGTELQRMY